MSYKTARGYVPLKRHVTPVTWPTYDDVPLYRPCRATGVTWPTYDDVPLYRPCRTTRQGDEMACRCGKRWPIGEDHP